MGDQRGRVVDWKSNHQITKSPHLITSTLYTNSDPKWPANQPNPNDRDTLNEAINLDITYDTNDGRQVKHTWVYLSRSTLNSGPSKCSKLIDLDRRAIHHRHQSTGTKPKTQSSSLVLHKLDRRFNPRPKRGLVCFLRNIGTGPRWPVKRSVVLISSCPNEIKSQLNLYRFDGHLMVLFIVLSVQSNIQRSSILVRWGA